MFNTSGTPAVQSVSAIPVVNLRPLMRMVYLWMGLGLLVTAFVSLFIASNEELVLSLTGWFLPIIIVQFGLVIALNFGIKRFSPGVALAMFFAYSATMGVTLSALVFAFVISGQSYALVNAFFTTAGLFGVMSVIGYTTKVDLSRFGSYLMMALIGLIIASFINILFASGGLSWIISVFGVLIFTALTAYDTQRIKEMAMLPEMQQHSDDMVRLSVIGALMLYLDFINLFIFLAQLFAGGSRD